MSNKSLFLTQVSNDLRKGIKHNKKSLERIGPSFGIRDKTEVKEYTELAIVKH